MRAFPLAFLATAVALACSGAGCSTSKPRGTGAAGAPGAAGAGAPAASGEAGTGSAGSTTGAAGTSGPAGTTGAAGAGSNAGFDDGTLFRDAGAVVAAPEPMASSDGGARADAGGAPVATGTLHINSMGLTAVFTQKGADVTVVVTATNCAQGSHTIQIHGGFSCDNAGTQGGVWDGKRGDGIPPLVCGADKKGSLTYTRSGADPATNWTVGDHDTKTDVTLHPAMAEGNCGTFF